MSSNILIIGAINIDVNARALHPYILGDSNAVSSSISVGGVGGNIAQNLAHLGESVSMITVLSSDSLGQIVIQQLDALSIDHSHATVVKEATTNLYISVLDEHGDLMVGLNDMNSMNYLTVEFLKTQHDYISSFDLIVLDNNLSQETLQYVGETYRNKFLVIDAVSSEKTAKILSIIHYVNILKMNVLEYETLLNGSIELQKLVFDMVEQGLQLIITNHEKTILLYTANGLLTSTPIPCDHIVSTSGAGDALLSGYVYGLLHDLEPKEALHIGKQLAYYTLQVPTSTTNEVKHYESISRN